MRSYIRCFAFAQSSRNEPLATASHRSAVRRRYRCIELPAIVYWRLARDFSVEYKSIPPASRSVSSLPPSSPPPHTLSYMQTTNQIPPQRRIRSSKRRILYRGDTSSNTHAKPAFQELLHEDASAAVRSSPHSRNRGSSSSSSSSSSSYYADDIDVKIDTSSNATTGIYSNAPYNNSTVVWDRNYTFHEYDANQYPMNYNNSNNDNNQEPLRIVPVLTDEFARFLSPYEREYLMQDILAPAISAWSDALWLVPIAGNNEDNKGDNEEVSLSNDGSSNQDKVVSQTLTIDKSQLWDSISCGPGIDSGYPSPLVPDEHFSVGVSDADLVVYVSLSFTGNNNDDDSEGSESDVGQSIEEALSAANNSGSGSSGGDRYPSDNETTTIPSSSPTDQNYIRGQTSNAEDNSFIDSSTPNLGNELAEQISNEILNTTNSDQSQNSFDSTPSPSSISRGNIQAPQCESRDTIASASYCNTDQYDRPIAGSIHFCINLSEGSKNDFFHPSQKLTNIKATMHELAHVLGFNPQSLAHFRNQDGSPRTPRDENGDVPDIEIECTGRSVANQPTATAVVPLPDPSILRFRTTTNGLRIASVVTENVRMVTRNHFDCQEMDGADLENSIIDSNSTSVEGLCIGSHWDRKVFKDDLMNPVIDPPSDASLLISPLTLAYFMDSGWYSINLDRVAPVSSWGRRKGCTFIDSSAPCIINNEVPPPYSSFFCSRSDTSLGCSSDLTRKASCGITEYVTEAGVTSRDFQHFGVKSYSFDFNINTINEVWDGGNDADLDYCPVFEAHQDSLCTSDKIPNKYIVSEVRFSQISLSTKNKLTLF